MLTQERGKTMGIVRVYLVEILLELTLGPISTHSHELTFAEMPPFLRVGHICSTQSWNFPALPRLSHEHKDCKLKAVCTVVSLSST